VQGKSCPIPSPSISAETSVNSGKSLAPENHHNSIGKSSQDSQKVSGQPQHFSENKEMVAKQVSREGSVETPLGPIQEV
jgi:hypothetical protein